MLHPIRPVVAVRASSRTRRRVLLGLALVAATLILLRSPRFQGNFGVVEPGRVFRSAQPEAGFGRLVNERGLKSVLNLRGGSTADLWYDNEVRTTETAGVDFYDFPMSATRRPHRRELLVLIDVFGRCRYPLLIHCKSGSDRTGLASALYRLAVIGEPPEKAERALSLDYWHFPIGGPARLHDPLVEYARWLVEQRLAHTPDRFRAWVLHDYRDDDLTTSFRPLRPGPREQVGARPNAAPVGPLSR